MYSLKANLALGLTLFLGYTSAQAGTTAVEVGAGTLGYTANVTKQINSKLNVRLGGNYFSADDDLTEDDVNYKAEVKSESIQALADWYPRVGGFRVTGGLMSNGNKIEVTAKPNANAQYNINDQNYDGSEVGSLTGEIDFKSVAPYIGIGFGNPIAGNKRWSITSDLGVMAQGKPNARLTATCGSAIAGTPTCTQLQNDVAAESVALQNDLSDFEWYPVASIALTYRF